MKYILLTTLGLLITFTHKVQAQADEGFIYGKVTTINDDTYTGAIRWGKEEVYWFDMFNSSKPKNEFIKYLSNDDLDQLEDGNENWRARFSKIWVVSRNYDHDYTHSFACNFGDIKSLRITGRERVQLEMKNGEILHLEGGSNDIGEDIKVYDEEIGIITLDWSRLDKIEFMKTPSNLKYKFGSPLYGTVETSRGEFTGFLQWDHDERTGIDKLDGDTEDGKVAIEFRKIKSIEKDGRGSLVTLNSGREFFVSGTNDVDDGNRGIIVNMPGSGRVDVSWDSFRKITFKENYKNSGPGYNNYSTKHLEGTVVKIDGEKVTGRIVYDLDEAYTMEILQGDDDDEINYLIPFRDIKKVNPKNYEYTSIELRSGKKILLSDSQDVNSKNDGVLLFNSGNSDPSYIAWKDIDEIDFK